MDPNANLNQIMNQLQSSDSEAYSELLELLDALADWLIHGGFDPLTLPDGLDWVDVLMGARRHLESIPRSIEETQALQKIRQLVPPVEFDEDSEHIEDGELWVKAMLGRSRALAKSA